MQLFKSQCLQEPPRVSAPTHRDRGFGRRYGRRTTPAFDMQGFHPAVAGNDDDGDFAFDAERAILRLMADYDCAA